MCVSERPISSLFKIFVFAFVSKKMRGIRIFIFVQRMYCSSLKEKETGFLKNDVSARIEVPSFYVILLSLSPPLLFPVYRGGLFTPALGVGICKKGAKFHYIHLIFYPAYRRVYGPIRTYTVLCTPIRGVKIGWYIVQTPNNNQPRKLCRYIPPPERFPHHCTKKKKKKKKK